MHKFIAICLCLSLIFIAGCSSQPIDKPSENKTDDIQYTETKKYAEDISDHAMSISAQLKLIDKDIASDMGSLLKTAAIETNTAVLRMHLSKARDITPPGHLKDLHQEYLASLEKINKGLTYLEQWAKNGNEDALAQGQELIAEGLQEGSSFAKQLNTEILIERQHN
jgi:hypothetical protein